MKLIEIISIIPDWEDVEVRDSETGDTLAVYNGKDSIPEELNDREVVSIYSASGEIVPLDPDDPNSNGITIDSGDYGIIIEVKGE